ncbi:MAG: PAS domain S-box protein [Smithellaceae bacterium]|nr:PAS domain S-box protein [Smithellaceae bacterium]
MQKRTLVFLVVIFSALCALLFNAFYLEAKNAALKRLNDEQALYARQASLGIQDFFRTWTGTLNSFAKIQQIIDIDAQGKRYIEFFYEAHREQIRSITRMDESGTIIHTFPFNSSIGRNISEQKHVKEILQGHKPVISDVFQAVQGFYAVALHVPVFKGSVFKGTIAIAINFESLAKRYLDVIRFGKTGNAWVISRDGTQLYSATSGFVGRSVLENYRDYPAAHAMIREMLQGKEGIAEYTFERIGDRMAGQIKKYAFYLPIPLSNTYWSLAVASAEEDVLSGLVSFKNRLILIIGLVFLFGFLFSLLGVKAWLILKEEGKRQLVEKELRDSEQRYRELFEHNPAPIFIYQRETLKILAVNDAFTHHYGYPHEEALSLQLMDLYPEGEKGAAAEMATHITGQVHAREWHHRKADGSIINIVTISHDLDYLGSLARMVVITDITARTQAEERLRESEAKYRNIFENAVEGIYQSTEDGRFITVNPAFARMAGYDSPEELIASIKDIGAQLFINPADRHRSTECALKRENAEGFKVELYRKDGSTFWVLDNSRAVMDEEGKIICFEGILEDITQRVQAEEKLQHTLESLRKAISATVQVMVSAVETKDPYTAGHQKRSADLARAIATELGLSQDRIDGIRMAGIIHDIGKLSVPAEILSKPTKLSEVEFSMLKEHARMGYDILKEVESPWPLKEMVYQHHERMDGSGYPRKLQGEEILLEARILAVADVVEAMASYRPYRPALGIDAALAEIEMNKGILYDAAASEACLLLFREKDFQLEEIRF